jgi:hypothetical protein
MTTVMVTVGNSVVWLTDLMQIHFRKHTQGWHDTIMQYNFVFVDIDDPVIIIVLMLCYFCYQTQKVSFLW